MLVRCNAILPDNSGKLMRRYERKRDKSQKCQFVEVDVVTIALGQSKSASDDLRE